MLSPDIIHKIVIYSQHIIRFINLFILFLYMYYFFSPWTFIQAGRVTSVCHSLSIIHGISTPHHPYPATPTRPIFLFSVLTHTTPLLPTTLLNHHFHPCRTTFFQFCFVKAWLIAFIFISIVSPLLTALLAWLREWSKWWTLGSLVKTACHSTTIP